MFKRTLAITIVLSAMSVPAYAQQCLHGPNEAPDQTARRREALAATRTINNIQFNQPGSLQRSFFRHEQLAESPMGKTMPTSTSELARRILLSPDSDILPGWKLTLDVSENGYWFMIKDTTDACGFAYISNHNGVIYTSEPIR
ncbi:MAG: hypothetical protein Q7R30_15455 [Acidobacteriota bacterium]|nr:hypothetical protein [Acidobacteriota bacterium]